LDKDVEQWELDIAKQSIVNIEKNKNRNR